MRLSPERFNAWLGNIGQQFLWRKSFACPCVNPQSGAADPAHALCGGLGRIWNAPLPGIAGVANQKTQREWAQFGVWESGDMVISVPSNSVLYAMGQFDRATMLNSTDPFSLVLTRGQNDVLRFPVVAIERVFWLNGGGTMVEGGIPTVDGSGALTWVAGEPPAAQQYTIHGTRFTEYYCYGPFPSDRGEHAGAALPKRAVLRRFDLFMRGQH